MAGAVYFLCVLTSAACAVLMFRKHRQTDSKLLLWSSLAFAALALSNSLVFADLMLLSTMDLLLLRAGTSLLAVALLVFGLVWNAE